MHALFSPTGQLRHFVTSLLLSVFVALSLIPAGFMPGVGAKGGAFITICSGYEQITVQVDDNGHPLKQGPANKKSDLPCAFTFHGMGGLVTGMVMFAAPVFAAVLHLDRPATAAQQALTSNHGARAPPSLQ